MHQASVAQINSLSEQVEQLQLDTAQRDLAQQEAQKLCKRLQQSEARCQDTTVALAAREHLLEQLGL